MNFNEAIKDWRFWLVVIILTAVILSLPIYDCHPGIDGITYHCHPIWEGMHVH